MWRPEIQKIPALLILFRLLAGPSLIGWVIWGDPSSRALLCLLILGILSDIFDGIIARALRIASVELRRWDSQADLIFWLCVLIATGIRRPDLLMENRYTFILLLLEEVACYALCYIRFRREPCTHAFMAKMYGLCLTWAMVSLLAFGITGLALKIAVVVGTIANMDVILILIALPKWSSDIPSAYHALLLRRGSPIHRRRLFN